MNETDLLSMLRAATGRRGLTRLLQVLGFTAPLRERPTPAAGPFRARARLDTQCGTICATVFELRTAADERALRHAARLLHSVAPLSHHLLILVDPRYRRIVLAIAASGSSPSHFSFEPATVCLADIEVIREMLPAAGDTGTAIALRFAQALDRQRLSERFFRDVAAVRADVARAWLGLPANRQADRDGLALLLLSRLIFLYFLQRKGLLAGRADFVLSLLRASNGTRASLYRGTMSTLFFGVLNRRPEHRRARARSLGDLPYLNGGLFDRHPLELRYPELDLPDESLRRVAGHLLEKYRFTARPEAGSSFELRDGVEPEMLGKIFERLMPGEQRSRTGSFYTPSDVADRLVRTALIQFLAARCHIAARDIECLIENQQCDLSDSDRQRLLQAATYIRILDPACGSGSFLLGALDALAKIQAAVAETGCDPERLRRGIVGRCLHGVDLLPDAALICSLRLWLALIPHCEHVADVPPLPNLDRRIRQGDALIDPFDLGTAAGVISSSAQMRLRRLTAALAPVAATYVAAGPEQKRAVRRRLARCEQQIASCWLSALHDCLARAHRELSARAGDVDLFGAPAQHAVAARTALAANTIKQRELRGIRGQVAKCRQLPFFSFRVHFAEALDGFDVILMNPPWVRAHKWPIAGRRLLRDRYRLCRNGGWRYAAELTSTPAGTSAQVDLSLLFLERACALLSSGGVVGTLLPAKLLRSLYAGGARNLLLEQMELLSIEDHSLDQHAVFAADAYAAAIVARRQTPSAMSPPVRVSISRRDGAVLRFETHASHLPVRADDCAAPWLLAPPDCVAVFRAMQRAAPCIGEQGLRVRRGAMTGANDVLLLRAVRPALGDLARVEAEGYRRAASTGRAAYRAIVEASAIRPVLRGGDIRAWTTDTQRHVLWSPQNEARGAALPPRLGRYIRRHSGVLDKRGATDGMLQRLSTHTLGHKVVWSDVASELRAAAVPAVARTLWGEELPVVPLNTAYFIATSSHDDALLLAAYLNSLPCRAFARSIAERAKDAHFRFFAWTIAILPLPADWRTNRWAERLLAMSRAAHERRGASPRAQTELDCIVARAYGVSAGQLEAIGSFDRWLAGGKDRP